jgi:hypothetical protein
VTSPKIIRIIPAIEMIVIIGTEDVIVISIEMVDTAAAVEVIIAGAANQRVIIAFAIDKIDTAVSSYRVVARSTFQVIIPGP